LANEWWVKDGWFSELCIISKFPKHFYACKTGSENNRRIEAMKALSPPCVNMFYRYAPPD